MTRPLVVGFDLDMTLTDPREGAFVAWSALEAELGVRIDVHGIINNLGPPLEEVLKKWVPLTEIDETAWRYRTLFQELGIGLTRAMPGAHDSVQAVRAMGGKVVVITAKWENHASAELDAVGIPADAVVGWRYGPGKSDALRECGADVYVGDQSADVVAAKAARVLSIGVATGSASFNELASAGADQVIESLEEFPRHLQRLWPPRPTPAKT